MVVGDDQLDAVQATLAQAEQEIFPRRAALAVRHLNGRIWRRPSQVDADRDQHRLAGDDAPFADLFVTRIEDQIGKGLGEPGLAKAARLASSRLLIAEWTAATAGLSSVLVMVGLHWSW